MRNQNGKKNSVVKIVDKPKVVEYNETSILQDVLQNEYISDIFKTFCGYVLCSLYHNKHIGDN